MAENSIERYIEESSRVKLSLLGQTSLIEKVIDCLYAAISRGGRIYSCGNGGSTCDAMHFAEELVARYKRERPGIPAQHLCDAGVITCWSNDYSFEGVFRRQVETLMTKDDVLVVFSTSGNSPNIISALEAAIEMGAPTVALLGRRGGKAKDLSDLSLVVESDETSHIQETHITVVHIICELLEGRLFAGDR